MLRHIVAAFFAVLPASALATAEEPDQFTFYIDADYTTVPAPARAIELGLKAAFAGSWAKDLIKLVPVDHRGNTRRSFDTVSFAERDLSSLGVIGGMHSPPYIVNGPRINALEMPLLLP